MEEESGDESKVEIKRPLLFSFPDTTFGSLREKLNITMQHELVTRGNHMSRVRKSAARGGDQYMSSKDMYSYLNLLQRTISKSEANILFLLDAMFFRVSAMLSDGRRMGLNHVYNAPAVDIPVDDGKCPLKLPDTVNYTVLVEHEPNRASQAPNELFVAKGKFDGRTLFDQAPEAIAKMYGIAISHGRDIIRGALSDGYEWIFVILYCKKNGSGGTYRLSPRIRLETTGEYPGQFLPDFPDIIAGILTHWVEHSFDDLDKDDWFK